MAVIGKGEQVAPVPSRIFGPIRWMGTKVEAIEFKNPVVQSCAAQMPAEIAGAGADFQDCIVRKQMLAQLPRKPPEIAHDPVEHTDVPPIMNGIWMVLRQTIQDFRFDDANHRQPLCYVVRKKSSRAWLFPALVRVWETDPANWIYMTNVSFYKAVSMSANIKNKLRAGRPFNRAIIGCILFILAWATVQGKPAVSTPQPVAYFKMGPLKEMIGKVNEVAGDLKFSMQMKMMEAFLGNMLGDPNLETISPTADINLVFYGLSETKKQFVLAVQLDDKSPIRDTLSVQGMVRAKVGGWSLYAKDIDLLRTVAASPAIWRIISKKRSVDLELGIWVKRLLDERDLVEDKLLEAADKNAGSSPENQEIFRSFIGIALDELFGIDTIMTGVNFSGEVISIINAVKARKGTALAALLNQKAGGEVVAGRFIDPDGLVSYMGRVDIVAFQGYFNVILGKVIDTASDDWVDRLKDFKRVSDSIWAMFDGTMAGVVNIVDDQPVIIQAGGSLVDSATFAKRVAAYNDFVNSEFIADIPVPVDSDSMFEMEFMPHAFDADGEPVHKYRMEVSIDPWSSPISQSGAGSSEEDQAIETGFKPQVQEFNFAVVNGLYLGTSKESDMFFLVDDVLSGQPLEKNLGNVFRNSAAALQFRIDLTPGLVMVADKLRSSSPDIADTINREVAAGGLQPIRGIVSIGRGKIGLRLNLPVTTIGRWISMYGIIQKAQITQEALEL